MGKVDVPSAPLGTVHCHACLEGPRALRWRRHWSGSTVVRHRTLPRQGPCRGKHLAAASTLPGPVPCRARYLAGPGTLPGAGILPWVLDKLPGKLPLPGPCFLALHTLFLSGSLMILERPSTATRQALPRDATTARAQVRGTRVPLF